MSNSRFRCRSAPAGDIRQDGFQAPSWHRGQSKRLTSDANGKALRNHWTIRVLFGCLVTLWWRMERRSTPMMKKKYCPEPLANLLRFSSDGRTHLTPGEMHTPRVKIKSALSCLANKAASLGALLDTCFGNFCGG